MLKYAPPTPPKYAPSPLSQFIAHPASYSAPRPPKRECSLVSTGGSTYYLSRYEIPSVVSSVLPTAWLRVPG